MIKIKIILDKYGHPLKVISRKGKTKTILKTDVVMIMDNFTCFTIWLKKKNFLFIREIQVCDKRYNECLTFDELLYNYQNFKNQYKEMI